MNNSNTELKENNKKKEIHKAKVVKAKVVCEPTITETEKFILSTVKGQNEQVRKIVTASYKSICLNIKSNVLIIGKSGTGKTEILKQLAKKLSRPCITVDANEFTQEGYYGRSVSEIILELLEEAKYDIEKVKKGIVIIDEIDKKATRAVGNERDVAGKGVLDALLKLIEGMTIKVELFQEDTIKVAEIKTDSIMFFFAGAFSGIDEIVKARIHEATGIGFSSDKDSKKTKDLDTKIKKKDLVKFGLSEEFIGRIDTIVQMNELSEEVLVDILYNSKASKLKQYVRQLKTYGITTKYTATQIKAFAKKAKRESEETGARELANILNYVFERICYDVMSKPKRTYSELIFLDGIEEDNTRYILK